MMFFRAADAELVFLPVVDAGDAPCEWTWQLLNDEVGAIRAEELWMEKAVSSNEAAVETHDCRDVMVDGWGTVLSVARDVRQMPTLQRMLPDLTDARFCSDNLVELCTNTRERVGSGIPVECRFRWVGWCWCVRQGVWVVVALSSPLSTPLNYNAINRFLKSLFSLHVHTWHCSCSEAEVIAKTIRFSAMLRERMLQRTQH